MMWCPFTRRGKKNQRMTEPRLGMTKSNGKYNHFGRLASLPKLSIHKSHERFILLLPTRPFVMRPPMRCLVFWELKWPLTPPLLPRAMPGRSMTPARWIRVRCRTDPGSYCPNASSVLKSPGPTSLFSFRGCRLLWGPFLGPVTQDTLNACSSHCCRAGPLLKHRRAGRQLPAGRGSRAFTSGTSVWVCGSGLPAYYRYRRCWLLRVQGEHRFQAFWWENFLFPFPTRWFQYTLQWIAVYFNVLDRKLTLYLPHFMILQVLLK